MFGNTNSRNKYYGSTGVKKTAADKFNDISDKAGSRNSRRWALHMFGIQE